jgi:hypothetical protein
MNELRKRPGRFEISESLLERDRTAKQIMELVMSNVFVVRCEHDYARGTFLYHAYSMKFDVIEEGESAPMYIFEFNMGHDGNARLTGVKRIDRDA